MWFVNIYAQSAARMCRSEDNLWSRFPPSTISDLKTELTSSDLVVANAVPYSLAILLEWNHILFNFIRFIYLVLSRYNRILLAYTYVHRLHIVCIDIIRGLRFPGTGGMWGWL